MQPNYNAQQQAPGHLHPHFEAHRLHMLRILHHFGIHGQAPAPAPQLPPQQDAQFDAAQFHEGIRWTMAARNFLHLNTFGIAMNQQQQNQWLEALWEDLNLDPAVDFERFMERVQNATGRAPAPAPPALGAPAPLHLGARGPAPLHLGAQAPAPAPADPRAHIDAPRAQRVQNEGAPAPAEPRAPHGFGAPEDAPEQGAVHELEMKKMEAKLRKARAARNWTRLAQKAKIEELKKSHKLEKAALKMERDAERDELLVRATGAEEAKEKAQKELVDERKKTEALRGGLQQLQKEIRGAKEELVKERKAIKESQEEQKMELREIAENKIAEISEQLEKKEKKMKAEMLGVKSQMEGQKNELLAEKSKTQQLQGRLDERGAVFRTMGEMFFEMADRDAPAARQEEPGSSTAKNLEVLDQVELEELEEQVEQLEENGAQEEEAEQLQNANVVEEEEQVAPDAPLDDSQQELAPRKMTPQEKGRRGAARRNEKYARERKAQEKRKETMARKKRAAEAAPQDEPGTSSPRMEQREEAPEEKRPRLN